MGAGQESCVRWAQARELRTDGCCLLSGMGAGWRGYIRRGLGGGAHARGDVAWGAVTLLLRWCNLREGARRLRLMGAASRRRPRARRPSARLAIFG